VDWSGVGAAERAAFTRASTTVGYGMVRMVRCLVKREKLDAWPWPYGNESNLQQNR
jgi:membrane-bound lytic murein transglycosylase MltF